MCVYSWLYQFYTNKKQFQRLGVLPGALWGLLNVVAVQRIACTQQHRRQRLDNAARRLQNRLRQAAHCRQYSARCALCGAKAAETQETG